MSQNLGNVRRGSMSALMMKGGRLENGAIVIQ
jgi:hypothetical protein